ncbi:MAG: AAA family ATPase [Chthoniobacterales bacterium]
MNPQKEFGLGVVIGKFLPPHLGHHFLIDTALLRCAVVVVIVCEKPSDPVPGNLRQEWLQEMHPAADIRLIDDRYDENDSRVWAANTIRWLGRAPDVVFTSEQYGDAYAAHMNCRHVMVDHARQTVPCSGTMVRNNPLDQWEHLSSPVRGWYAKRIVVLGAESTGTTTLAQALAEHFKTTWVAEYGREYSFEKQVRGETEWKTDEFHEIAQEQTCRENLAAREANRFLFCDTNAFATTLWHRRYMGFHSPLLEEFARHGRVDLYILTGDEIPFVQDGLRDGEFIRHEMHCWFEDALSRQCAPFEIVRGSVEERLRQTIETCRRLFQGEGIVTGVSNAFWGGKG